MTAFEIYSAVGGVGEDILEESEIMPRKKFTKIIPIAAAAACFAVLAVGISHTLRNDSIEQPAETTVSVTAETGVSENKPVTEVTESTYFTEQTSTETTETHTETSPTVTEETTAETTETTAEENEETEMPVPFINGGGDANSQFYATTNVKLGYIDMSFIDLVGTDEFEKWIGSTSSSQSDLTSVGELANLYSFIGHFDIPDDVVREKLVNMRIGSPDDDFTDEEIDLLLSGDGKAVAEYFAADTAIVKDGNLYSLKWVYYHSHADYAARGITPEEIKSRQPMFDKLYLTDEARAAIKAKIDSYNG
ncbi:MAG: hypothetical protein NC253_08265 [Ruminococcus sp.]|nr:hypothetical protein [Ruminococcus sp.]MCM1382573.1 hypothetical protein [Muribaculaceae bacterium]MCM1479025.1 hypothetical protein [Muribaculaceae bacterium]